MSILPIVIYRLNTFPIKIPMTFLTELEKITLQVTWNHKRLRMTKTILREKKAGGITLPDFKLYYPAIVIKTIWYSHKNGQKDQWKRTESLEINPCQYGQPIFDKIPMNTQWKMMVSNKQYWENWKSTCRRMKLDPNLIPLIRVSSK